MKIEPFMKFAKSTAIARLNPYYSGMKIEQME